MPELLPNIKEFNEITAVIFAQLYVSFPIDLKLEPVEVGKALGVSESSTLPSGRAFNEMFSHTLVRLIREGFVDSYGTYPRERCVLTTKAMTVMNVIPPNLKQPLGSELREAAENGASAANKSRMAELIGDFFGSFTGSVWKSLGNG
jgi:hypothetical protein